MKIKTREVLEWTAPSTCEWQIKSIKGHSEVFVSDTDDPLTKAELK